MDLHATALLKAAENWDWKFMLHIQKFGSQDGKFKVLVPKLLSGFIEWSHNFGGDLLDLFWTNVKACDPNLEDKVETLERDPRSIPSEHIVQFLFEETDPRTVKFEPVLKLATELFIHLGIAFMNLGRRKSGGGSPLSVGEIPGMHTDELLQEAAANDFGVRKEEVLKLLARGRDGHICMATGRRFRTPISAGVDPVLAHVIPRSVYDKPDTLKFMTLFAGEETTKLIRDNLNNISNAMNLQRDAHADFDKLYWGIEADVQPDDSVKYVYRRLVTALEITDMINLEDGAPIFFGNGPDGSEIGGPHPRLCNIHHAIARVLRMSGAADVISMLQDDADDSGVSSVSLQPLDFHRILTAKLLNSGRVTFG